MAGTSAFGFGAEEQKHLRREGAGWEEQEEHNWRQLPAGQNMEMENGS